MPRAALCAAALILVCPAVADAATVHVSTGHIRFDAAPGEMNHVRVDVEGSTARFVDAGASLEAGSGCTRHGGAVDCHMPGGGSPRVALDLGDRDDHLVSGRFASGVRVDGGAGDDRIAGDIEVAEGGDGNDELTGGEELRGGEGDDRLTARDPLAPRRYPRMFRLDGGPGNDALAAVDVDAIHDGGPGSDSITPGSGRDTVTYRSRVEAVHIDLRTPGGQGTRGENDHIGPGIEVLEGSIGDDVLIAGPTPIHIEGMTGSDLLLGGPADDTLGGGAHHDVIVGGEGNDKLHGGPDSFRLMSPGPRFNVAGDDTIDGGHGDDTVWPGGGENYVTSGPGTDRIHARDRGDVLNHSHIIQMSGADQVWCGDGDMDRIDADYADNVALDCEIASEGTPRWRDFKVRPGRRPRLTVRCAWSDARPCKGIAGLRTASGHEVAEGGHANELENLAAPMACRVAPGTVLASARFRIRAGRVNYVYLDLNKHGRKLLRDRGCVAVFATLAFNDARRRPWFATRSLLLRRLGFVVPR